MITFDFEKFVVNATPYSIGDVAFPDRYLCTVHLKSEGKISNEISETFTIPYENHDNLTKEIVLSKVSGAIKNGKDRGITLMECAQDLTLMAFEELYKQIEDNAGTLAEIRSWAEEFEKIWWETPEEEREDYLDTLQKFAESKLHPINLDLLHIEDRDIIQVISTPEGKQIKYLGYFYKADDGWRNVCILNFQVPLDEWKRMSSEEIYDKASEHKQYISDYKEYELKRVLECYLSYHAVSLPDEFLNKVTPDGTYIL